MNYSANRGAISAAVLGSMSDVAQGCFGGAKGSPAGYWVPADHFTPPHFDRVEAGATVLAVAFPPIQARTPIAALSPPFMPFSHFAFELFTTHTHSQGGLLKPSF